MDDATRAALEGSTAKWQAIVNGTGTDDGATNCPLCAMFYDEYDDNDEYSKPCNGCPVRTATGSPRCEDSPYEKWSGVVLFQVGQRTNGIPERVAAAQAELDFLISLREPVPNTDEPG